MKCLISFDSKVIQDRKDLLGQRCPTKNVNQIDEPNSTANVVYTLSSTVLLLTKFTSKIIILLICLLFIFLDNVLNTYSYI